MDTQSFFDRVIAVVKAIPKGSTLSYKEVAQRAGSPKAYRAVGTLLKKNCDLSIPCHRVIKSDGSLGDFNRGAAQKKRLLIQERLEKAR